jgi:hypothetical protein
MPKIFNKNLCFFDNVGRWIDYNQSSKRVAVITQNSMNHTEYTCAIAGFSFSNGAAHFINVNNCIITNINSYLETSGGQSSLYLNVVHFSKASVN